MERKAVKITQNPGGTSSLSLAWDDPAPPKPKQQAHHPNPIYGHQAPTYQKPDEPKQNIHTSVKVVYQPGGYSSLSLADGSEDDRFSHKEPKPFPSYDSKHSSPPSKPSFTNPHTSNPILGSEYTKPSSIFGPPQHPVSQSVPKPHPYSQALSSQDNPLTQGANKFDIYPQPKKSLPQFTQPHSHAQAPGYGHHVPAYGDHAAYGAHPGYGARAGPAPSLTSSGVYGAIPQSYGPASGAGAGAGAGVGERSYPGTYPHSHAKIAPSGAAIHYPHQQPPPPQPKTDPTVHTSVKIHHPPGGASSITF